MPRVTLVKKAQKDYPAYNIKKGESYYWWKFRYGPRHVSKVPPRASQLTQSGFLGTVYAALEGIEDLTSKDTLEDIKSTVDEAVSTIRDAGEECSSNKDNMPEGLQEGPTGELLENRSNDAEELASNLESVDLEPEEDTEEAREAILDELQGYSYDGE